MIRSAVAEAAISAAYSRIPGTPSLKATSCCTKASAKNRSTAPGSLSRTMPIIAARALAPNSDGCVVREMRGVICGVEFRPCTIIHCQLLWNRNDDFANVLAGFHVAMRVCDVLQVKRSINYRDKFPGLHSVNNESFALVRRAGTRVVSNSV